MNALAAIALLCLQAAPHDAHEHAGIIARQADGTMVCANQTTGDDDRVRFALTPPPGDTTVAMYHTHLSFPNAEYFSDADTRLADKYQLPSFLLVGGKVAKVYTPGQTKMVPPSHLTGDMVFLRLSLGDPL